MNGNFPSGPSATGEPGIRYRDSLEADRVYFLVFDGAIALLLLLALVFVLRPVPTASLSLALTGLFLFLVRQVGRRAVFTLTDRELIIRYLMFTFRIALSEIASAEITSALILPPPLRGHVKFILVRGLKIYPGLLVLRLRGGEMLRLVTRSGRVVYLTARDNRKLLEALQRERSTA